MPSGFWQDIYNLRKALDKAQETLDIKQVSGNVKEERIKKQETKVKYKR